MLNFVCPELKVLIETIDITALIESFTISRPRAEPNTPYSWSGNMILTVPLIKSRIPHLKFLEDLEPTNPYRHFWARGNKPIQFYFKGVLFVTLRIAEYFYDEDEYKSEVGLQDLLGILDFKSPAENYKGLGFTPCQPVSINQVVTKALQEAGFGNISVGIGGNINVPPNKPNGSWIKFAQSYLGERGYWLYCDRDEGIRIASYSTKSFLFERSRQQIENFKREKSPQLPADKYVVTGSAEKFVECKLEDEIVTETFGESTYQYNHRINDFEIKKLLQLRERVINYPQINKKEKISKTIIEQSLGSIFPKKFPDNTTVVITSETIKTLRYDDQGRLIFLKEVTDKLLGVALPDVFDGNTTMRSEAEIITEEYRNQPFGTAVVGGESDDGVLRFKRRVTKSLFVEGTFSTKTKNGTVPTNQPQVYLVIKEQVDETWNQGGSGKLQVAFGGYSTPTTGDNSESKCECNDYHYRRVTLRRDQKQVSATERYFLTSDNKYLDNVPYWEYSGLKLVENYKQENTTPQPWTTKEGECPTCQSAIKATVSVASVSYTATFERQTEASFSTLGSLSEAIAFANLTASMQHQRYYGRTINLPIPEEYILNPKPFSLVNLHNGQFVIDSPSIIYTEEEAELAFVGNYVGAIAPIPEPIEEVFQAVSSDNLNLQIRNTTVYESGQVAIALNPVNGNKPFTFNFNGDFPSELKIENNFIVGEIANPGNYPLSVVVMDNSGATAISHFDLEVVESVSVEPVIYTINFLTNYTFNFSEIAEVLEDPTDELIAYSVHELEINFIEIVDFIIESTVITTDDLFADHIIESTETVFSALVLGKEPIQIADTANLSSLFVELLFLEAVSVIDIPLSHESNCFVEILSVEMHIEIDLPIPISINFVEIL